MGGGVGSGGSGVAVGAAEGGVDGASKALRHAARSDLSFTGLSARRLIGTHRDPLAERIR
jgi:hypothetical protein